jgi:hypothetical protein
MRYIILFAILFSLGAQSAMSQSAAPFTTNYRDQFIHPLVLAQGEHSTWLSSITIMASWYKDFMFNPHHILENVDEFYQMTYQSGHYLDMLYFEALAEEFGLVREAPRAGQCLSAADLDFMLQNYGPVLFLTADGDYTSSRRDIILGWIVQGMWVDPQNSHIYIDAIELPHGVEVSIDLGVTTAQANRALSPQTITDDRFFANQGGSWLALCAYELDDVVVSVFHYSRP